MSVMILGPEDITEIKKVKQRIDVASGVALNGRKTLSMIVKLRNEEIYYLVENRFADPNNMTYSHKWERFDFAIEDFNSR